MFTWQIIVSFVLAAGAIGCLLGICSAVKRLSEAVFFVRTELTKINSKLEAVEVAGRRDINEPDESLEAIETAISNFEKLKRVDLTKS
jgi:hypothetical protein